jgi:TetR/AcrR family tetracycline transcriptional repressor
MKAKNSLSPDLVVASALRIVDEQGLEALTVRKVADEFGVTPMALYWHFSNKEALLEGVVDFVVSTVREPDPGLPLEDYLRQAMIALVDAMRAHPGVAPLMATRMLSNPVGRDITETVLDKLMSAGCDLDKAAAVAHYALMIAMSLVSGQPGSEATVKPADREEALAAKLAVLESLPADRYPRLRAAAPAFVDCVDASGYYGDAIDIFVNGVLADLRALDRA